jgi:transcriptional regulator with XRE-family HTH domain
MAKTPSIITRRFGPFVKSLRAAREKTQEQLAEASDLSVDTIRRLEGSSFSPSLDTLVKLVKGLRIDLEVLFAGFERGEVAAERELIAMARSLSPDERRTGLRILVVLAGLLGAVTPHSGPKVSDDG